MERPNTAVVGFLGPRFRRVFGTGYVRTSPVHSFEREKILSPQPMRQAQRPTNCPATHAPRRADAWLPCRDRQGILKFPRQWPAPQFAALLQLQEWLELWERVKPREQFARATDKAQYIE